jgi:RNA polymerase sigma-70 factor (subfamily 1)
LAELLPSAQKGRAFAAGEKGDGMPIQSDRTNHSLGQFRAYLETLTYIQIDPRLRSRFGLSDIIQKTLIEAWLTLERIEAMGSEDQKCWLRRMLINNLKDMIDHFFAQCRDARREQSLEEAANGSKCRLIGWLAAEESTPSGKLIKQEERLRVLEALAQLPERQREALILQQYHGWKLAQIAEHLGCTTNAVAGLHARGLAKLRTLLADRE